MSDEKTTDLTLQEAADRYAEAKGRLPRPGDEFRGPEDARHFEAFQKALFELERAAMRAAAATQSLAATKGHRSIAKVRAQ